MDRPSISYAFHATREVGRQDILSTRWTSCQVDYGLALLHTNHLQLFLTMKGYIGLGSECLEIGDSLWFVPGSRVLVILRKVDRKAETVQEQMEEFVLV